MSIEDVATPFNHRGLNIYRIFRVTRDLLFCRVVVVANLKKKTRAQLCIYRPFILYSIVLLQGCLNYHNGKAFSTYDQDHDNDPGICATQTWLAPGPNWFFLPSCWDQFLMGQQTNWGELLYLLYQIQVTQLYTE